MHFKCVFAIIVFNMHFKYNLKNALFLEVILEEYPRVLAVKIKNASKMLALEL